jgi:hypothetical protein
MTLHESCEPENGKRIFVSAKEAMEFAASNEEKFGPQRVYVCPRAPHFHLTSKEQTTIDAPQLARSNFNLGRGNATQSDAVYKALIHYDGTKTPAFIAQECNLTKDKSGKPGTALVYIIAKKHDLKYLNTRTAKHESNRSVPLAPTPLTLLQKAISKRQLLEKQLREVQSEETRLQKMEEENNKVEIKSCEDGLFLIIANGGHLKVTQEHLDRLWILLSDQIDRKENKVTGTQAPDAA